MGNKKEEAQNEEQKVVSKVIKEIETQNNEIKPVGGEKVEVHMSAHEEDWAEYSAKLLAQNDGDIGEDEGTRMYDQYKLWPELCKHQFVAKTIKKAQGKSEVLYLQLKPSLTMLIDGKTVAKTWVKELDINRRFRDYAEFFQFKGVGASWTYEFGAWVSRKTGKLYWGIRFDLKNGSYAHYALTHQDFMMLCDKELIFARKVGA